MFTSVRFFSVSTAKLRKVTSLKTKAKSASSQQWLERQLSDPYIEKAKQMKYRCRSAFKLIEIDDRYKLLQPGNITVDCGACPGSWTQVVIQRTNADNSNKDLPKGTAIAIDQQHIFPLDGATIFSGMDFTLEDSQRKLLTFLNGEKVDTVVSDMAPTATGIRALDNENILKLCYSALRFSLQVSKTNGNFLVKLWQCGETKKLENDINKFYSHVQIVKPNASRSDSTEIFILARQFKGLLKR